MDRAGRWALIGGLCAGVLLLGGWWWQQTILAQVQSKMRGWDRVCFSAPYTRLTDQVMVGLRQTSIQPGLRGWQPTVAWVNEQCEILGF